LQFEEWNQFNSARFLDRRGGKSIKSKRAGLMKRGSFLSYFNEKGYKCYIFKIAFIFARRGTIV
jgi:hypothetical protein